MAKFAEHLKYERELRGWSQARMAEALETTPNRISSWEREISLPSAYFREKLCQLFDKDTHQLGLVDSTGDAQSVLKCAVGVAVVAKPATVDTYDTMLSSYQLGADRDLTFDDVVPVSANSVYSGEGECVVGVDGFSNTNQKGLSSPVGYNPAVARIPFVRPRRVIMALCLSLLLVLIVSTFFVMQSANWLVPRQENPYAPYQGRLVLDDDLRVSHEGTNWQEGTNATQARCLFKAGGYVAFQPRAGFFHACIAQSTDYANFAYEVKMTIRSGEFGGLIFRSENGIDAHYYQFRVYADSSYQLYRFSSNRIEDAVLLDQGTAPTFKRGLQQQNLLAVVAQNDQSTLYVNGQQLSTLHDAGYIHGQIGVLAGSLYDRPSEAFFTDARVWSW